MPRFFRPTSCLTLVLAGTAALTGCGLQKSAREPSVLKTEDFIADGTTAPTQSPAEAALQPATPLPPVISAAAASDGILNVSAIPGAPADGGTPAQGAGPAVIVDAKVGELNGKPVRAQQVLDDLGPLLSAKARDRKLSRDEWAFLRQREPDPGMENTEITREQWLAFAQKAIGFRLNSDLETQLLAEEARFSLKPEQRQGLKYMVQEAAETARREAGGSRAASQENMREHNTSEHDFARRQEAQMLVQYELAEKLRNRIRTSWKDVRLYYERNSAEFNPPPVAHFRRIHIPADRPDDIALVRAALAAHTPFATVAESPLNTYRASEGGRVPDQPFQGEYEQASFFNGALEKAAHDLKPGQYTAAPLEIGKDLVWLSLDSIERHARPLSDPEVQLTIAHHLNDQAFNAERFNYITRLKQRATFTDVPAMASQLADIAAARYWPKE